MTYTALANQWIPAAHHYSGRRGSRITHIGIHHIAGTNFWQAVEAWRNGSEEGSCHVAISNEGEIIAMVAEENGAWSFSNSTADNFSLVMEIENQTAGPNWLISDAAYEAAARVSADWRKRYGNLTMMGHNEYAERGWSYSTYCPGNHRDGSPGPEHERVAHINALAIQYQNESEDDMYDANAQAHLDAQFASVLNAIRREERYRLFHSTTGLAALGRPGSVLALSSKPTEAKTQVDVLSSINALMLPPGEVAGSPVTLAPTAFYRLVDSYASTPPAEFGVFVGNFFDVVSGPTVHRRSTGAFVYDTRQAVWADLRAVQCTYDGVSITAFKSGGKAVLSDGSTVQLTPDQVARANAQRPNGQDWT